MTSPTTMTIPHAYALMLVQAVEEHHHSLESLLEHAGISLELWRGGGDITALQFARLYQRTLWLMRDESFGMLNGDQVPIGSFRMLCLSVIHCRNLREVTLRLADFCDIAIGYEIKPSLEEGSDSVLIRIEPTKHAQNRAVLNSRDQLARTRTVMLMWHNFLSWFAGRSVPLLALHFCHNEAKLADFLNFSPDNIKRGMSEDALKIPNYAMDWPVVQDERSLNAFLNNAIYHLICAQSDRGSLSARVVNLIAQAPSLKLLRASDVAEALACSEATLRRRLSAESTSFQTLKDQYRQSAAIRNLSTSSMSLKEVANICGFENTAEFNRAFRRWTGDTPGNYRKNLENSV